MGILNISEESKSKWIQFDEDTEVCIKLLTKDELRRITQKAAKASKHTGIEVSNIADKLLGRAAVLGWRKIQDHNHPGLIVDGQPLPYTQDNIDKLMQYSLRFSRFVNDYSIDEEAFKAEEERGEEIKNG